MNLLLPHRVKSVKNLHFEIQFKSLAEQMLS